MKIKHLILIILSLILVVPVVYADDYQDGVDAFDKKDFNAAFKKLKPLAEKGHAKSQTNLGILYYNGKGVLKDYKKAVEWLTKAAEQGEVKAQFILGEIYIEGKGAIKSFKTAKYWVQLAYENGFEGAKALWDEHELWKY